MIRVHDTGTRYECTAPFSHGRLPRTATITIALFVYDLAITTLPLLPFYYHRYELTARAKSSRSLSLTPETLFLSVWLKSRCISYIYDHPIKSILTYDLPFLF